MTTRVILGGDNNYHTVGDKFLYYINRKKCYVNELKKRNISCSQILDILFPYYDKSIQHVDQYVRCLIDDSNIKLTSDDNKKMRSRKKFIHPPVGCEDTVQYLMNIEYEICKDLSHLE